MIERGGERLTLPGLRGLGRAGGEDGLPAPPRTGEAQLPPWQVPPARWTGPLTEWAVFWDLVVRRKFVLDLDFTYQKPIPAPGLNQSNRNRSDFWILPAGKNGTVGGYERGIIINPISFFTHEIQQDRFERAILAAGGWLEIYIDEEPLMRDPHRLVGLALRGEDVSSRRA